MLISKVSGCSIVIVLMLISKVSGCSIVIVLMLISKVSGCSLDLQLLVQSVSITTNVVNSGPAQERCTRYNLL